MRFEADDADGGDGDGHGAASEDGTEDRGCCESEADAGSDCAIAQAEDGSASGGAADSDGGDGSCDGDGDDSSEAPSDAEPAAALRPSSVLLLPSAFPSRPPTIFFDYPEGLGVARRAGAERCCTIAAAAAAACAPLFRTYWERNSIKNAFYRAGFERTVGRDWLVSWGKHLDPAEYQCLTAAQRVNHFPGSWCIGRKDRLMRTIGRARRAPGADAAAFDFLPRGFLLPAERRSWLRAIKAEPKALWILKPPASSCGKGIRVISRHSAASAAHSARASGRKLVAQRYIASPMLIDGRKFDLRLYVLVTSIDPLRVWLFSEGLVRISTRKYSNSPASLRSRFIHLTNYSVNKKSATYSAAESGDAEAPDLSASKWSLTAFWAHLAQQVGPERAALVRRDISDVVVKTLLAADAGMMMAMRTNQLRNGGGCFELFGFDVLLDAKLRPWLLEVNVSPSLLGSSALDQRIKGTLMADTFHLIGVQLPCAPRAATAAAAAASAAAATTDGGSDVTAPRQCTAKAAAPSGSSSGSSSSAAPPVRPATASSNGRSSSSGGGGGGGASDSAARTSSAGRSSSSSSHSGSSSGAAAETLGPTAAWRRRPQADSIDLAALGADALAAIADLEDEKVRAGGYALIFPTADAAQRLLRAPGPSRSRYLGDVLTRWVTAPPPARRAVLVKLRGEGRPPQPPPPPPQPPPLPLQQQRRAMAAAAAGGEEAAAAAEHGSVHRQGEVGQVRQQQLCEVLQHEQQPPQQRQRQRQQQQRCCSATSTLLSPRLRSSRPASASTAASARSATATAGSVGKRLSGCSGDSSSGCSSGTGSDLMPWGGAGSSDCGSAGSSSNGNSTAAAVTFCSRSWSKPGAAQPVAVSAAAPAAAAAAAADAPCSGTRGSSGGGISGGSGGGGSGGGGSGGGGSASSGSGVRLALLGSGLPPLTPLLSAAVSSGDAAAAGFANGLAAVAAAGGAWRTPREPLLRKSKLGPGGVALSRRRSRQGVS